MDFRNHICYDHRSNGLVIIVFVHNAVTRCLVENLLFSITRLRSQCKLLQCDQLLPGAVARLTRAFHPIDHSCIRASIMLVEVFSVS